MELVAFLVVGVGVLVVLARGRFGRGSDPVPRRPRDGEPQSYGNRVRPPGTSAAMDVNAAWFRRPHDGDGARDAGPSGSE